MTDPMQGINYDAWKLASPDEGDEEPEPEACDVCAGIGWLPRIHTDEHGNEMRDGYDACRECDGAGVKPC